MFKNEKEKAIRKGKKLPIKQIAELMGIMPNTLYRWEAGLNTPSESDIRILASLLNIHVSEISDLSELPILDDNNKFSLDIKAELKEDCTFFELDSMMKKYSSLPRFDLKLLYDLKNSYLKYRDTNNILKSRIDFYENILDEMPDIVYIKDNKLTFRYVNKAYMLTVPNYLKEDVIGHKTADIFGIREMHNTLSLEQMVFKTNEPIYNIKVNIPSLERSRYGVITILPFKYQKGNLEEIICCIKDTSEWTRLMDQLNFLKFAVDNSNDAVFIKNMTTNEFEFISSSVEKVTGYNQKEYYVNPDLKYEIIQFKDLKKYKNVESNRKKEFSKINYIITTKNGEKRNILSEIYHLFDNKTNNNFIYIIDKFLD